MRSIRFHSINRMFKTNMVNYFTNKYRFEYPIRTIYIPFVSFLYTMRSRVRNQAFCISSSPDSTFSAFKSLNRTCENVVLKCRDRNLYKALSSARPIRPAMSRLVARGDLKISTSIRLYLKSLNITLADFPKCSDIFLLK